MTTDWRILSCFLLTMTIWPTTGRSAIVGKASWYGQEACEHWKSKGRMDCPTASGEDLRNLEARGELFAASYAYPLGTMLRVCRADHDHRGEAHQASSPNCVVVRVKDRGPARRLGRVLDLSKLAFSQLAPLSLGLIRVEIEPLR